MTREYRPTFIDLPFSDKSLRVTFNKQRYGFRQEAGISQETKEIELFVTLFDASGEEIWKDKMILSLRKPKHIPHTSHQIMADFIYLPPNPSFLVMKGLNVQVIESQHVSKAEAYALNESVINTIFIS